MTMRSPVVSVGLPVYNGEPFLEDAIRSVLSQTYTDFELIISDNASTDRTEEICRDCAAADQRIRYFRNPENLGAAPNFNLTLEHARGQYFKWIAADGEIYPEFLMACLSALEAEPQAVLACTKYHVLQEDGKLITPEDHLNRLALLQDTARGRVKRLGRVGVLPIWGLMRLDVLRQTPGIRSIVSGDRCLIIDLAIKGKFAQVPEYLAVLKRHPNSYTDRLHASRFQVEGAREAKWFDARSDGRVGAPRWQALREACITVSQETLSLSERLSLYYTICTAIAWRWRRRLLKELFLFLGLGNVYLGLKKVFKPS